MRDIKGEDRKLEQDIDPVALAAGLARAVLDLDGEVRHRLERSRGSLPHSISEIEDKMSAKAKEVYLFFEYCKDENLTPSLGEVKTNLDLYSSESLKIIGGLVFADLIEDEYAKQLSNELLAQEDRIDAKDPDESEIVLFNQLNLNPKELCYLALAWQSSNFDIEFSPAVALKEFGAFSMNELMKIDKRLRELWLLS